MPAFLQLNILHYIVNYGIDILIFAMLVRVITSWFRIDERYAIIRFLAYITDPFIQPIRRIVRSVGVLDLSFLIAWFLLSTLRLLLLQSLPSAW
jgi:YggT family protein